jgi:hypothetical protein
MRPPVVSFFLLEASRRSLLRSARLKCLNYLKLIWQRRGLSRNPFVLDIVHTPLSIFGSLHFEVLFAGLEDLV